MSLLLSRIADVIFHHNNAIIQFSVTGNCNYEIFVCSFQLLGRQENKNETEPCLHSVIFRNVNQAL